MGRRLLILKCSARKRGDDAPLPALERYDGPLWQVLRSYQRQQPLLAADLDVHVLSAAFGLIPASDLIPWYDRTMAPERADELRPGALAAFEGLMAGGYDRLCLGLSQRYLRALEGWEGLVPPTTEARLTDGPMGAKLGQLRAWLEGRDWEPIAERPERLVAPEEPRGEVVVAGVTLRMTRDEVLARARAALASDGRGAGRYRDWCVLVDGRPVAPKWLVGLLSGLPTSAFDASAARRALLALGVDVERAGAKPFVPPAEELAADIPSLNAPARLELPLIAEGAWAGDLPTSRAELYDDDERC